MLENNKIITDEFGNEIRFSNVLQFNDEVKFFDFSAKYVDPIARNCITCPQSKHTINKKPRFSSGFDI